MEIILGVNSGSIVEARVSDENLQLFPNLFDAYDVLAPEIVLQSSFWDLFEFSIAVPIIFSVRDPEHVLRKTI